MREMKIEGESMKYYDIMDKEEKGIYISFTDKNQAEEWLSEQPKSRELHIKENERLTIQERREKAFAIANNAIYFNDRSDYLSALFDVCTMLNPKFECSEIGKKYIVKKEVENIVIGEEIIVKEDKQIKTILTDKVINVKKGDKAIITKEGITYLTGEARGKSEFFNHKENILYDIENISKIIVRALMHRCEGIEDYLNDYEVKKSELYECVADELERFI